MYPGNTHLKPVIGLDIHFVNIPFPCPLPHPYIGLVIDPFDYIPFIGATVKINGVPRGNTDTMGKIITFIHIPFGAGFTLPPLIGHDSQNFFGSKNVQVDGAPLSGAGYMLMTCNDIGLPLSLSPGKKFIPIPSLYLPTSFCIPLQWGPPVMVGGPMVPHFSLLALLKGFAFGSFLKVFGKIAARALSKLNKVLKKSPASQKLSAALCKMGFEPVDLVTGRVNYEYTDFEIPGPIPIKWTRNWDSDSRLKGSLGYKTHLCYDRYIQLFPEDEALAILLPDGRAAAFPLLQPGEQFFHPTEQITLTRKANGHFLLHAHSESLYYHFNFEHAHTGVYKLSFIEDYSGFRVQLHYSGRHLSAITDAVGRKIICTLNNYGQITSVELQYKQQRKTLVQYGYNSEDDLILIKDALQQAVHIIYNDQHLMTVKTDRNGQSFYWEYDSKQRCIHTWGDGGILEGRISYQKGFNIVTNSLQEQTTYYYNENNLCIETKDHYGNSSFSEYTEIGQLYREIDEEGHATGYTYDNNGLLKEVVQPDGSSTSYNYNQYHQLVLITYPDGAAQTYVYDDQHRLSFINYPDGHYNSYTFNQEGLIAEISSRGGGNSILQYDADANLQQVVFTDGSQVSWRYDMFGRCVETTDAGSGNRHFVYDDLDRVTALHLADGNRVQLQYNAYEEVLLATDKQYSVAFEYTPLGNVKKRTRNNDDTVVFGYDTNGRLVTITNEAGKVYSFTYNGRGEMIKERGYDAMERFYERDKAGKTIKTLRPGGKSSSYEYDANGHIVKTCYHDGSWELFGYDKSGQLTEAVNQHNAVTIKRNKSGLMVQETQNGYSVTSKYDQLGNRVHLQSNLGADVRIQRNTKGLAAGMQAAVNTVGNEPLLQAAWQAQYKYNIAGQEIDRLLPGGISTHKTYDSAGHPLEQRVSRHGVVESWKKYTWETNDRLTKIFDALEQGSTRFRHNAAGNLVWAQYADNSIVTRYTDIAGNLYETETYGDRRYTSAGAIAESPSHLYKYDEEGNLLSKIEKGSGRKSSYSWYANGMLQKVVRPDGIEIGFKYDALGRRTEKSCNGKVKRFIWDGDTIFHEWEYSETDRPIAVVTESGKLEYDRLEPVENLVTWIFDADASVPAAKMVNGTTCSIISDYLGTPSAMYDEKGKKVWEGVLDIYGRLRTLLGRRDDIPFRYQGQYEDVETGLYYNRFRYYSPEEGIYVSQDPIRLEGDNPTLYAYVRDVNVEMDLLGLTGIGAWGEKVGAKYLSGQGHQVLGSVQNASNHGFDLVTKTADGNIHIIEIKTSQAGWNSKSNMPRWTNNNINTITNNTNGHWSNMPGYQHNLMDTIEKARAQGKLKNKLLQININKRSIKLKCK
jgi:RHS repeat-associated protein